MSYFTKRYHPPGTAPGTLKAHKEQKEIPLSITLMDYTATSFEAIENASAEQCRDSLSKDTVTWIHIQGNFTTEILNDMGAMFGLHSLALEDVLNSGQRPKADIYENQLFVVCALGEYEEANINVSQVSIFCGTNYIVSFYSGETNPFALIKKRLKTKIGGIRSRGADYLLYALLDTIIDGGFPLLEKFGEHIEALEFELLEYPDKQTLTKIHQLKRELLLVRRMLWPQRELVNTLLRDDTTLIQESTKIYLRDCYDHTVQIMDLIETFRDMTASMLDVYLSSVSNRMNDIMRVLTIIATIFIPLTFIVGVYGMNFNRSKSPWAMPELDWYYGYPLVMGLMLIIAIGMLIFFRRKDWL